VIVSPLFAGSTQEILTLVPIWLIITGAIYEGQSEHLIVNEFDQRPEFPNPLIAST